MTTVFTRLEHVVVTNAPLDPNGSTPLDDQLNAIDQQLPGAEISVEAFSRTVEDAPGVNSQRIVEVALVKVTS